MPPVSPGKSRRTVVSRLVLIRYEDQISISIYGDIAIHELSAHKTVGVGFQILGE